MYFLKALKLPLQSQIRTKLYQEVWNELVKIVYPIYQTIENLMLRV